MNRLQVCELFEKDIPSGVLEGKVLSAVPRVRNGSCALCGRGCTLACETACDNVDEQVVLILGLTEVTAVAKLCEARDGIILRLGVRKNCRNGGVPRIISNAIGKGTIRGA